MSSSSSPASRTFVRAPKVAFALGLATWIGIACSSSEEPPGGPGPDGGDAASAEGGASTSSGGSSTSSGGSTSSSGGSSSGGSSSGGSSSGGSSSGTVDASFEGGDAGSVVEADAGDAGDAGSMVDSGTPALLTVGRFDVSDPAKPRFAWPGTRILARFDGTSASVTLTHADGTDATSGNDWINVVVDGVLQAPREVSGAGQVLDLTPGGLAAGVHTVEIEKRTEANIGTLRLDGFTFSGGAGLLAPPARATRRIEFVSESTIDGFGVDGNGWNDPLTCNMAAPSKYNDARKSVAFYTATSLSAEHHLIAFSGKGVARNNDGSTNATMSTLWTRTLPEVAGAWDFATWKPDVVVVSLGGADYVNGGNAGPANFQTAYAALVTDIRARYGADPYVFLLVWSQLKDYNGVRAAVRGAIDAVVAGRPAGERTYRFQLPEALPAVETGCYFHANAAHHQAMSDLLAAEIKAKTGW